MRTASGSGLAHSWRRPIAAIRQVLRPFRTRPRRPASMCGLLAGRWHHDVGGRWPAGAAPAASLTADFGANGWEGDIGGRLWHADRPHLSGRAKSTPRLGSQYWLHGGTGGTRIYAVRKLNTYEAARAARLSAAERGAALWPLRRGGDAICERLYHAEHRFRAAGGLSARSAH